jgi:hypothetical protein
MGGAHLLSDNPKVGAAFELARKDLRLIPKAAISYSDELSLD